MRKLSSYIGRYWYGYVFAVASMVTAIALDMLYPQITQKIVDDVILGGQMEILTKLLTGIVLVGIGRSIFGYCKEFTFDFLSSKIGAEMRKDLFNHIQTLSMRYFDDTNTGELMARVKDDVDKIQNALGYVGMLLIEVTIHVVFVLYCMFSLNWKMAFLPVTVMLCCAVVAIIMERKLDKVYEDISEENAVLTTVAEENLAGVRTVKAFAREDYEIKKFLSHNERYYNLNITQSKVLVRYYPLFQFVGKVLPVAITILGGISVMNGNMSLGALVAYVEYSRNCTWPMEMMGWLTNDLSSAVASYKKIKKIYEVKPEIEDSRNVVTLDHVSGNVEFDHVSFKLDGKQILSDISFSVKEGKTLGIMGATGSGKSSVVNLIPRFYDATKGSVQIGGKDVREYSLEELRGKIGMVLQKAVLFKGTIRENMLWGNENATDDAIMQALEDAQAKEFVDKKEGGLDFEIEQGGKNLSGGQRQRMTIARAVVKKPDILILDDSASALDFATDAKLRMAIRDMENKATVFIVSQRAASIMYADKIIVLDDGRIVGMGTHEELLKQCEVYQEIYYSQFKKTEDEKEGR